MTLTRRSAPAGTFVGRNFMTPEIIGHYSLAPYRPGWWAELAQGRGIAGERIFGVTVAPAGRFEDLDRSLGVWLHSRRLAEEYIEELATGKTVEEEEETQEETAG